MTTPESLEHDWANCEYCWRQSDDPESHDPESDDPESHDPECWCPDCIYAPGSEPPDDDEDVYRAHVRMTGMAPPHNDGSRCNCLFPTGRKYLAIDPGSSAAGTYESAYAEYLSLMRPVWQEIGAPDDDGDKGFFRAVIRFDARMRALTRPPLEIDSAVEAEAYINARIAVTRPDLG